MATYAQLETVLTNIAGYVYFNLQNVIGSGADTWDTRADTLLNNLTGFDKKEASRIDSTVNGATSRYERLIVEGQRLFTSWRREYGRFVNSRAIAEDGSISNDFVLQRDIVNDMKNVQARRVVARGITFAGDPADDVNFGYLRRLTVDHLGNQLEAGKRNQTTSLRARNTAAGTAGEGRVTLEIYGEAGGENKLDYQKGSGTSSIVSLNLINERNEGAIANARLSVQTNTSDGDPVSQATNPLVGAWVISNVVGVPTVVVRTSNQWRSKTYGIAVSGQTTTWRLEIPLLNVYDSAFDPILPAMVTYWDGTWTGTYSIVWGGITENIASAAVHTGGAGFYGIFPSRDANLYATNWDQNDAKLAAEIATTSAAGEIKLDFFGVLTVRNNQGGRRHQGLPYFAMSAENDPGVDDSKSYVDVNAFTGRIADMFALCNEEAEWAILSNVVGGVIPDPV